MPEGTGRRVLDLSWLSSLEPAGVRLLVEVAERAGERDIGLCLVTADGNVIGAMDRAGVRELSTCTTPWSGRWPVSGEPAAAAQDPDRTKPVTASATSCTAMADSSRPAIRVMSTMPLSRTSRMISAEYRSASHSTTCTATMAAATAR